MQHGIGMVVQKLLKQDVGIAKVRHVYIDAIPTLVIS